MLTALLLALLCIPATVYAQDQAAIEAKIREMNKTFAEQMISGTFTTDQYTPDAISMPNNQPMLQGLDAIKANAEQMKTMGFKFETFEATPVKILVNGKQVTEIGTYSMSMIIPEVPQPVTDKGKYLTLWEIQDDGSLKIKVETWNTDLMPGQM